MFSSEVVARFRGAVGESGYVIRPREFIAHADLL